MTSAPDPRWIVLTEEGHINMIGRHTEPSQAEIERVEIAMGANGVRGWIAIMDRSAYAAGRPEFMVVQEMREPKISFEVVVKAALNNIKNPA
jgi:hypothetical protein